MISLFISTAVDEVVIAVLKEEYVLYSKKFKNDNKLSIILIPEIKLALEELNINIKSLNKVYCVNGPGSFTGIRIGLTVAKTLCYSLDIDLILLSQLEFMATTDTRKRFIAPLIDARRGYVFAGLYDRRLKLWIKDYYIKYDDFINLLKNEYDIEKIQFVSYEQFDNSIIPEVNISKIVKKHIRTKSVDVHLAKPNYLKKTEAEEKRNDK